MSRAAVVVGMAVSQDRVDLALRPPPDRWAVAHDARGTATLLDRLRTLAPALSVLEATGGLELPRTGALAAAGRPVVVVTPRQGRDFATATGQRAKTAVLDAAILAQFAEVVRPALRPLPAATTQALSAMRARRRQRLAMRTAESNRLGPALPPGRKGIRAPRAWRDRQLAQSSMPS